MQGFVLAVLMHPYQGLTDLWHIQTHVRRTLQQNVLEEFLPIHSDVRGQRFG